VVAPGYHGSEAVRLSSPRVPCFFAGSISPTVSRMLKAVAPISQLELLLAFVTPPSSVTMAGVIPPRSLSSVIVHALL